jgi:hypothetical protein
MFNYIIFLRKEENELYQMCDQFRIRENFTKTFVGFKTRVISK